MPRPARAPVTLAVLALTLTGCGHDPTPPPGPPPAVSPPAVACTAQVQPQVPVAGGSFRLVISTQPRARVRAIVTYQRGRRARSGQASPAGLSVLRFPAGAGPAVGVAVTVTALGGRGGCLVSFVPRRNAPPSRNSAVRRCFRGRHGLCSALPVMARKGPPALPPAGPRGQGAGSRLRAYDHQP